MVTFPIENAGILRTHRYAIDVRLSHPQYRADIDGLRALAVLLVVAFHAFPEKIPGGFIGVDIFFVISGFLISSIIFSNLERDSFSFLEFYSRRIKRILPSLVFVMIATCVLGWFILVPNEYKELGKHLVGVAAFISNFVLWNESGYFDSAAETKPLLHLWSLAIEEQFYVFWPIFLALAWKQRQNFLWITASIAVASFTINLYLASSASDSTFYSPASRFWELMIGGLLSYVLLHNPDLVGKHKNAQSGFGFFLIAISLFFVCKENTFRSWLAVFPTLGTFFIISAGPVARLNSMFLSNKACVWVGIISYPLYLWHWPILSILYLYYGTPSWAYKLGAVILSLALASMTYYVIERNVRRASYPWIPASLIATLLLAGFMGLAVYYEDGFPSRTPPAARGLSQLVAWEYWSNSICKGRYPYKPKEGSWWFCIQNRDRAPSILLLGNSHANDLYPGLVKHEAFRNQTILAVGGEAAAEADPVPKNCLDRNNPQSVNQCDFINFINGVVERTKPPLVIVNSSWPTMAELGSEEQLRAFVHNIDKRIEQLEQLGSKVVLVLPRPKLRARIKDCYPWGWKPAADCQVPRSRETAFFVEVSDALASLTKSHQNLKVFDQFPLFCDSEVCRFRDNNGPFIRDDYSEHLSVYGSERFANAFARWAEFNLPELLTGPTLAAREGTTLAPTQMRPRN